MATKVNGGNFYLGNGLEMEDKTLAVTGAQAEIGDETLDVGVIEIGEDKALGIQGTDDVYIFAGDGKNVIIPQGIVIKSSTASSTKLFKITVIDDGTLSATEIS